MDDEDNMAQSFAVLSFTNTTSHCTGLLQDCRAYRDSGVARFFEPVGENTMATPNRNY
jgi:hypothetical protein